MSKHVGGFLSLNNPIKSFQLLAASLAMSHIPPTVSLNPSTLFFLVFAQEIASLEINENTSSVSICIFLSLFVLNNPKIFKL